jgi:hypothetical protein
MAEVKGLKPDWDAPGGVDAEMLGAGPLPAETFAPQTPSGSEALRPHGMCQLYGNMFRDRLQRPTA